MITYKDQRFCHGSNRTCINEECFYFFSHKDMEKARAWAGDREPTITFCPLDEDCEDIIPLKEAR